MHGLLGTFMMSVALASPAAPPSAPCTQVAHQGTELRRFVNSLRPGDVGCLRAGTYGGAGIYSPFTASGTGSRPITLRGYPGDAAPSIRGFTSLEGDHLRLGGLVFDGPNGAGADGKPSIPVYITGDDVELAGSEVHSSRSQGIYLQDAARVRLVGNYIGGNGQFGDPGKANLDHGIYFASGSGLIEGNVIRDNYAYGVQLYPSAAGVLIRHNLIVGNGRGGIIVAGAEGRPRPEGNRIEENVIALNGVAAVTTFGPVGAANDVRSNTLWQNGPSGSVAGLRQFANTEATSKPDLVGPPGP